MAVNAPIPVFTTLDELFPDGDILLQQGARYENLVEEYEKRFGTKPIYIVRAPGRVNILGEHIDYALFGVLPAAIERDTLIAVGPNEQGKDAEGLSDPGCVIAENLDSKYTRQEFAPSRRVIETNENEGDEQCGAWFLDIDTNQLRWESYVKAGYYGVLETFFNDAAISSDVPKSLNLLITGTVPPGSGLSSSAALVVASTLSLLAGNDKLGAITRGKLVEMTMQNEKRVGVNSGGMDQASSILSSAGSALYITFFPHLAAEPVPLPSTVSSPSSPDPSGLALVCANSLVRSDKLVHARTRYNVRVVETLVAARILARELNVPLDVDVNAHAGDAGADARHDYDADDAPAFKNRFPQRSERKVRRREKITLREVLDRWLGIMPGSDRVLGADGLKEGLKRIIPRLDALKLVRGDGSNGEELGMTLHQMISLSGLSSEEFEEVYLSWVQVEATHFQLYKRAKHVYTEALRVLEFREACLQRAANDSEGDDLAATARTLGAIMDASHASCAQLFECSCPELDLLTRIAREAGAYGSRLTGAGWGGYTISLVDASHVPAFIAKLAAAYPAYQVQGNPEHLADAEVIFLTKPSSGASVFMLT